MALAALLVSSFLIFSALYLAPGDPVETLSGGRPLGPQAERSIREEHDLDKPFLARYGLWLAAAARGDLGKSIVAQGQSVGSLVGPRVKTTAELLLLSTTLISVMGVLVGTVIALRGGHVGKSLTVATSIGMAIPAFASASLLISVFAVALGWFPVFGTGSSLPDELWHLTLPAVALSLSAIAYVARVTDAAVARELRSEHVETARARGLNEGLIIRRHVLRNAAIPIATVIALMVTYLLAGTAIVEKVFGLDGLGSYLVEAVQRHDLVVVQAICLIFVAVCIAINAILDVLYAFLDPHVKL